MSSRPQPKVIKMYYIGAPVCSVLMTGKFLIGKFLIEKFFSKSKRSSVLMTGKFPIILNTGKTEKTCCPDHIRSGGRSFHLASYSSSVMS